MHCLEIVHAIVQKSVTSFQSISGQCIHRIQVLIELMVFEMECSTWNILYFILR